MNNRSVCVFCGGNQQVAPRYLELANEVGLRLARNNVRLVYGGASVGTMGAVANAALAGGGRVLGVIPRSLSEREIAHHGVSELRVVDSMHVRKQNMADASDAFVALPGGFGTMDELFEITTWKQIHLHNKPVAVLSMWGYYDALFAWVSHAVSEGFIPPQTASMLEVLHSLEDFDAWLARVPSRAVDPR